MLLVVCSSLSPEAVARVISLVVEKDLLAFRPKKLGGRDDRWQLDSRGDWAMSVDGPDHYRVGFRIPNSPRIRRLCMTLGTYNGFEVQYV